jgi:hypothetical protein
MLCVRNDLASWPRCCKPASPEPNALQGLLVTPLKNPGGARSALPVLQGPRLRLADAMRVLTT